MCVTVSVCVYAILYVLCVRAGVCDFLPVHVCFLCMCDVFSVHVCVHRGYHHAMSVLLLDSLLQAGLYDMYLGQLVSRYIGSL